MEYGKMAPFIDSIAPPSYAPSLSNWYILPYCLNCWVYPHPWNTEGISYSKDRSRSSREASLDAVKKGANNGYVQGSSEETLQQLFPAIFWVDSQFHRTVKLPKFT